MTMQPTAPMMTGARLARDWPSSDSLLSAEPAVSAQRRTAQLDEPSNPATFTVDPGKVEQLKSVFPEVEADVIVQLLAFHDNNAEQVVELLLDVGITDVSACDLDETTARSLQLDQDEQAARALAASITKELADEAKSQAHARTVGAVGAASTRAKKFLLQRVRPGRSQQTSVRLLDTPPDVTDGDEAPSYDMTPLAVPAYEPPTPVAAALAITSAADAPSAGRSTTEQALYNSRLDRARSANRVRSQSRLSPQTSEQPSVQVARDLPVEAIVPEGQLI